MTIFFFFFLQSNFEAVEQCPNTSFGLFFGKTDLVHGYFLEIIQRAELKKKKQAFMIFIFFHFFEKNGRRIREPNNQFGVA